MNLIYLAVLTLGISVPSLAPALDKKSEFAPYRACFSKVLEMNTTDEAESAYFESVWGGYVAFESYQDGREGIFVITDDVRDEGKLSGQFFPWPAPKESFFKNKEAVIAYIELRITENKPLFVHYARGGPPPYTRKGVARINTFPPSTGFYKTGFTGVPADMSLVAANLKLRAAQMIGGIFNMYVSLKKDSEVFKIDMERVLRTKREALKACEAIPDETVKNAVKAEREKFSALEEYRNQEKVDAEAEKKNVPAPGQRPGRGFSKPQRRQDTK